MKTVIFAYSRNGIRTAERLFSLLDENQTHAFTPQRLSAGVFRPVPEPSSGLYEQEFAWADTMVFVSACGIAVRKIAPFIRSKVTDPAVLCIDEQGRFVIPILSGHIGGANDAARKFAEALGAEAVITTATDINGRFSVDSWAVKNGFLIDDMSKAKAVSAAVLEQDIPLVSTLPVISELPNGIIAGSSGELGIFIGWEKQEPFAKTLRLIPKILHLGIGCRSGTEAAAVRNAVSAVLENAGIDPRAVKCAASIDLKAGEAGLLEYCRSAGIPVSFYSAEELMKVPGDFTASDFVKKVTGADNVCERAAMKGADRLIVKKTACNGVTVAVAAEKREVRFG